MCWEAWENAMCVKEDNEGNNALISTSMPLWALLWGVPWYYLIARTPALTPSINTSVFGNVSPFGLLQARQQLVHWHRLEGGEKCEKINVKNTCIDWGSKGRSPSYYLVPACLFRGFAGRLLSDQHATEPSFHNFVLVTWQSIYTWKPGYSNHTYFSPLYTCICTTLWLVNFISTPFY